MAWKRIGRWAGIGLAGILGLVVVALGVGFAWSQTIIGGRPEAPLKPIAVSTGLEAVERGRHLGQIYGCAGCHGANLTGGEVGTDDPMVGTLITANLTRALPDYTDAQLARAIREGVRADGGHLWGMPSESWIEVTDAEMADLIAWLRSHPPAGEPTRPPRFGPLGRLGVITGQFKPSIVYAREARGLPSLDAGPEFATGRHLAATVCSECHRSNLEGDKDPREAGEPKAPPDLMIAAAYDLPLFTRLMRTGIGMDGKEHGLMTEVSRGRFVHMTDAEIAALHAYLTRRAEMAE